MQPVWRGAGVCLSDGTFRSLGVVRPNFGGTILPLLFHKSVVHEGVNRDQNGAQLLVGEATVCDSVRSADSGRLDVAYEGASSAAVSDQDRRLGAEGRIPPMCSGCHDEDGRSDVDLRSPERRCAEPTSGWSRTGLVGR